MCYDRFGLRRWLFAAVALGACSSKARIEIHVEHGASLTNIDSVQVHANLVNGPQMGDVTVTPVTSFFNNCSANIVNIVVGDHAPADVHLTVTAYSGSTIVGMPVEDRVHVDSGEVKTYFARINAEAVMVPSGCEPAGTGGTGGVGGSSGTGGTGGSSGTGGTGGTGGDMLGYPCTSSAQCSGPFSTCLMSVLTQIPFPNGYCTEPCPPGNDCGPNGTWGEWTIGGSTECWCQRTCNSQADCHRSDGYTCCRSSPLPDGGTPPPGACNPPAMYDPQYCN